VDDESREVTARDPDGREIGQLRFRLIEGDHLTPYYKLVWAYLDRLDPQYSRQGLERAALHFWTSLSGQVAAVERHTGIPNEEGSHLTSDVPPCRSARKSRPAGRIRFDVILLLFCAFIGAVQGAVLSD
jgi:hypothetical protein